MNDRMRVLCERSIGLAECVLLSCLLPSTVLHFQVNHWNRVWCANITLLSEDKQHS